MTFDEGTKNLATMLLAIEDFRNDRGKRYRLCDLLLMCIYGILAGNTTSVDIHFFINLNFSYFKEILNITSVPSHDTFSRVLRWTNFKQLSEVLNTWLEHYYPEMCIKYGKFKILHVDGKAVRAANEKSNGEKPIYLLNAMYEGGTIMLQTMRVGEKGNEITFLPDFLSLFNLNGIIVTIDAIGNNKVVIDAILSQGGQYLTIVKENQKNLYNAIENQVEILKDRFDKLPSHVDINSGHGRITKYTMTILEDTSFLYNEFGNHELYSTIGTIGILDKCEESKVKGEWVKTNTRAYIICSLEGILAEDLLWIKKSHWNIEMEHWKVDVFLNEDRSTARKNSAVLNSTILKRFAMNIKKKAKDFDELSLRRFGMYCGHNLENISKILFGPLP